MHLKKLIAHLLLSAVIFKSTKFNKFTLAYNYSIIVSSVRKKLKLQAVILASRDSFPAATTTIQSFSIAIL